MVYAIKNKFPFSLFNNPLSCCYNSLGFLLETLVLCNNCFQCVWSDGLLPKGYYSGVSLRFKSLGIWDEVVMEAGAEKSIFFHRSLNRCEMCRNNFNTTVVEGLECNYMDLMHLMI